VASETLGRGKRRKEEDWGGGEHLLSLSLSLVCIIGSGKGTVRGAFK
jgi:hypothetical protein